MLQLGHVLSALARLLDLLDGALVLQLEQPHAIPQREHVLLDLPLLLLHLLKKGTRAWGLSGVNGDITIF